MKLKISCTGSRRRFGRYVLSVSAFASLLLPGNAALFAQATEQAPAPDQTAAVKIPAEQLDSLVAPIALYPDPLLSQTLVASTYPLELIQLHQWLQKNNDIKDQKKLADKVSKQPWDPSIQAMAPIPTVVKWLAEDIQYTTDLGNAFLAQQADVMEAVQRMRAKAKEKGALASNEQQKVETQVVESKQVIVIEQANPQVVYVPSYNPTYVYGSLPYPYPPIYYPPYYGTGAVIAAGAISFGVGVAIGAAWGNGGWGWGCGWGGNDINVNINNNFNRNYNNIHGGNRVNNINNIQGGNRNNINNGNRMNQGGKWQHNAAHRGGAPYGDRNTANRFGGAARGDSLANRQSGARNQLGRQGNQLPSTRDANRGGLGSGNRGAGVSDRSSGLGGSSGNRGGNGSFSGSNRGTGVSDRSSGLGGNRGGSNSGLGGNRSGNSGGFGGGSSNRMGSSSSNRGGFGGGSGGYSGSSARSSSSRGMSSMGGSRGGGFGGGGMSRGGGGGMRGGGRRR